MLQARIRPLRRAVLGLALPLFCLIAFPGSAALSAPMAPLSAAAGATFYVSPTGSDSNPGTLSAPWRTPQHALDAMNAGDSTMVRAGSYTGQTRCDSEDSGSATGGYVTLKAYPGETPVLTGAVDGIVRIACSYFQLEGFDIAGPAVVGGTNIYPASGNHVRIIGNQIHDSVCQGISMDPGTADYEIIGNRIYRNGVQSTPCDQQAHGLYLQGDRQLVKDNLIYDNHDYGIQAYPYGRDSVVAYNTSTNNGKAGIVIGGGGSGPSGSGVAGIKVVANILASNSTWGVHTSSPAPSSCDIHGNVVYGNASGGVESGFPSGCVGSNVSANPLFVNLSNRDLHLQAGSPAIDVADSAYAPPTDFDGITRPQGAGPEIGAYERPSTSTVSAPANTAPPQISGTPQQASTLSASTGTWANSPTAYAYQWRRCDGAGANCASIAGASAQSYLLAAADVGSTVRVVVTASNAGGSSAATSAQTALVSAPAPAPSPTPANTSLPAISGTPKDGATLSASNGSWTNSPTSYAYQWRRCDAAGANCVNIAGAAAQTYLLVSADVGSTVRVLVTASNASGSSSASSAQTAAVAGLPPVNTLRPVLFGSATSGGMLTSTTGIWSGTQPMAYKFQWRRCNKRAKHCSTIAGATGPSYTLTAADVGSTFYAEVTATNLAGSAAASTYACGTVAGTP